MCKDNNLIFVCSVFVEYGMASESRGFAAFSLAACRRLRQLRVPQARRPGDGGGFAHACDRLHVRRDRRNTDSRARACVPEAALRAARFNSDHTSVYREISRRHFSWHAADASVAGGSANHWRLEDFGSAATVLQNIGRGGIGNMQQKGYSCDQSHGFWVTGNGCRPCTQARSLPLQMMFCGIPNQRRSESFNRS